MRVQLEFQEGKARELRSLMEKVEIRKYHEFFNNALTLTRWAIEQAQEGRTILSWDEDTDRKRELVMPFLSTVSEKAKAGRATEKRTQAAESGAGD